MRKINQKSKFFTKVLIILIIASMTFPGAVYSLEAVKIVEDGQDIGPVHITEA